MGMVMLSHWKVSHRWNAGDPSLNKKMELSLLDSAITFGDVYPYY
jgi:hypothetical protein